MYCSPLCILSRTMTAPHTDVRCDTMTTLNSVTPPRCCMIRAATLYNAHIHVYIIYNPQCRRRMSWDWIWDEVFGNHFTKSLGNRNSGPAAAGIQDHVSCFLFVVLWNTFKMFYPSTPLNVTQRNKVEFSNSQNLTPISTCSSSVSPVNNRHTCRSKMSCNVM